jgi:hypothetical protein
VLKDFEVFAVSYEETGSELVALLKESEKSRKTNLNTMSTAKVFSMGTISGWKVI